MRPPPVLYYDDRYRRWAVKTLLRDGVDVKTFRGRRKAEKYHRRAVGSLALAGGGGGGRRIVATSGYDTSEDFSSFSFSAATDDERGAP